MHAMAKMLNGTHSWIAFDTSLTVGVIYYKCYLMKAIQAPESLPITAVRNLGWVTIQRVNQKERVFIDLHNRIYSSKDSKYLTILQAGIMIDPTLTEKMNLYHELINGFPCLPPETFSNKHLFINGELGVKALGRYINEIHNHSIYQKN